MYYEMVQYPFKYPLPILDQEIDLPKHEQLGTLSQLWTNRYFPQTMDQEAAQVKMLCSLRRKYPCKKMYIFKNVPDRDSTSLTII